MISNRAKSYLANKIRLAWRFYDEARKDCLKTGHCVHCQRKSRKLYADHIAPVGSFNPNENPYIVRMFCPRENLQSLCKECHKRKTKKDLKMIKTTKREKLNNAA